MRPLRKPVLLAMVMMAMLPRAASAAEPGPESPARQEEAGATSPRDLFKLRAQEIGIAAGYGAAVESFLFLPIGETSTEELREVKYVYVAPRWGIGISDPLGGDAWYRGNFELLVEGAFYIPFEPTDGFGGGISAIFRYNFLPKGLLIPFVEVGPGILITDFGLEDRADGFNFTFQTGLGFHFFLAERTALTAEARFHHISNAGIDDPNRGLNSVMVLIGVTIFLK
ncbi:MAG: acyloxyacyl hydrolase [Candidatus Methylomirabilales bacterium]